MISVIHLLWIIPLAVLFGVLILALIIIESEDRS